MGVGKTPTAIMYANLLAASDPGQFRALAIVPASIRLQWRDRIRTWSTIPNVQTSALTTSQRGIPPNNAGIHWTIMSYDTASNPSIYKAILANHYDLLVLDEAHYLKTASTARTRQYLVRLIEARQLSQRADKFLLSPERLSPTDRERLTDLLTHSATRRLTSCPSEHLTSASTPERRDEPTAGE